jgi:succinyl-diaminopimelate desuccinylase
MNRDDLSRALDREVEALRDELIQSTTRILQFETVSGAADDAGRQRCREQLAACAHFLETLSTKMGFRWLAKPGRWYCIEWPADKRPADKRPLLVGIPTHIDVVPASGAWTHPPFSGDVADGVIWGRGTQDDKGPLLATLFGLYALKRIGFRPSITTRIIIGTQEEIGDWGDLREYFDEHGFPDFGFTPDANFPIIIAEKGIVNLDAKAKWDAAAGRSNGPVEFVALKGGVRSNVVPDLCELTIHYPKAERDAILKELFAVTTQFTVDNPPASITLLPDKARDLGNGREELLISFLGKSAHGSLPEKGHNAALDALKFVADTETFPEPARLFARFLHVGCSDFLGNKLDIASRHDFVGATTVNLGIVKIDGTEGQATINVRATLGMDRKEVIKRAGALAKAYAERTGLDLSITGEERGFNAHYLDPKLAGRFLTGLQEGFQAVTGELPELRAIGGTTYAKAMPNCCAFGPILESAGEEELAHQADEHISVDSQIRNTKIYGLSIAYASLNLKNPPNA